MDILDYYKEIYPVDLKRILDASGHKGNDRLSVISLIDDNRYPDFYGLVKKEFLKLCNRSYFLLCFFFDAIFDQAVHSSLREFHTEYDNKLKPVKFVGALGGYWYNMHPIQILQVEPMYNQTEITEFIELTDFRIKKFESDLLEIYCSFCEDSLHFSDCLVSVYTDIINDSYDGLAFGVWLSNIGNNKYLAMKDHLHSVVSKKMDQFSR